MGAPQTTSSSFSCNLRIIRAKNIELKHRKYLFVRCYLSAGDNKRVQFNSQEISSNSGLYWNRRFSLDCLGSQDSINSLKQENIVFELRCRSNLPVLGSICRSEFLARAEVPWRKVLQSPDMEISETWVPMILKSGGRVHDEDVKPPAVQIAIKVNIGETTRRRNDGLSRWDECGCIDGVCNCLDYDMFALGMALEAL